MPIPGPGGGGRQTASAIPLHVGPTPPAGPDSGWLWVDTSDDDYPELKTWSGRRGAGEWHEVDDHTVNGGPRLPNANPHAGTHWLLTAADAVTVPGTTYQPGWYICTTQGVWTLAGPSPAAAQQQAIGASRAPRTLSLWRSAAARPPDPFAGLAAGAYGDSGWIARPTGWELAPGSVAVAQGQSLWRATSLARWDELATPAPRWAFGAGHVSLADSYSAQYSTHSDGRAAHSAPTAADAWERHRDPHTGAWSAWLPIHTLRDVDWITLVDASTLAAGNRDVIVHSLPSPIRLADMREMMIEARITGLQPAEIWRGSRLASPYYEVAGNGDSSAIWRPGISVVAKLDRDGTGWVTSGQILLPAEDTNVGSSLRWGIFGQFRRGPTDPAGTASYFDVLFSMVRGLRGRWYLRMR